MFSDRCARRQDSGVPGAKHKWGRADRYGARMNPQSNGSPVALVSGARGGLGVAVCAELRRRSIRVVAGDLATASGAPTKRSADSDRHDIDLDVTDPQSCDAAVAAAIEQFGRLDYVVHLAGVRSAGLFLHTPHGDLQRMAAVNYFGVTRLTRSALGILRPQRSGRIVIVTSVGALAGIPGLSGYCASKFATEGWAESLAMEVARFGVAVSLVEPASFRSGIWDSGDYHVDENAIDAPMARHLRDLDTAAAPKAFPAERVATRVAQCCTMRVAPTRLPVGASAWARHAARGVVPGKASDRVMHAALRLPDPMVATSIDAPTGQAAESKRVLVTGASSGLGRSLIAPLQDAGWIVTAAVRSPARADQLRVALAEDGRASDHVEIVAFDQRDPDSVAAALLTTTPFDAVVVNAGMKTTAPFEELPDEALVEMYEINTLGSLSVIRETARAMAPRPGRFVVIGSSSGFTGMPTWSGYAASKFALEGWADSVRIEFAARGLRLTLIEPGAFESDIWRDGSTASGNIADYDELRRRVHERESAQSKTLAGIDQVSAQVLAVLAATWPPSRVAVGLGSRLRQGVRGIAPSRLVNRLFG